ncbi:hypothetical protein MPSEU_000845700 [Mayamaea pseudoterrestris]|nr:hypothetical protein MPSEU_000845700 [Mayamaea pseudoterrestris]
MISFIQIFIRIWQQLGVCGINHEADYHGADELTVKTVNCHCRVYSSRKSKSPREDMNWLLVQAGQDQLTLLRIMRKCRSDRENERQLAIDTLKFIFRYATSFGKSADEVLKLVDGLTEQDWREFDQLVGEGKNQQENHRRLTTNKPTDSFNYLGWFYYGWFNPLRWIIEFINPQVLDSLDHVEEFPIGPSKASRSDKKELLKKNMSIVLGYLGDNMNDEGEYDNPSYYTLRAALVRPAHPAHKNLVDALSCIHFTVSKEEESSKLKSQMSALAAEIVKTGN